jgi:NADH-quinone oxidoreductase subunit H
MSFYGTYIFLGALQSTTQIVSYEISIGLIRNVVLIRVGLCNFSEIVIVQKQVWFGIPKKPKHMPSSCVNKNK